jgi:hypothetical protein
MTRYYTYRHRAGYGSDDHLAGELIARAARRPNQREADAAIANARAVLARINGGTLAEAREGEG